MKKIIFATLFCLFLCGSLYAQTQQVTMQGGESALGQVFKEIESQAGLSVDYDAQEVDVTQKVTVPAGKVTVKALHDAVLDKLGYTSTIRGTHVIVKTKQAPQKPTVTVSGTVVDTKGDPAIGVGVLLKGTSQGTVTGADGRYTITVPGNAVLVFSSMGYKTVEVAVENRRVINLEIEEDALFLEDAVVVGYGVQKKENLTGAVSVVSSKSIQNRTQANLGNILQGTVPGLTVTSPSGRPGEAYPSTSVVGTLSTQVPRLFLSTVWLVPLKG